MFSMGSDKISFVSTVEGLEQIEECLPKPAKHFIPKWFKDMPMFGPDIPTAMGTVKMCPSFPDYFSQGYIVPMWSDSSIRYMPDMNNGHWSWTSSADMFKWEIHPKSQLLNHVDAKFNGVEGQFIFKAVCPWKVITPPGWSVLQLPLFYHFNQEWSVLPGVLDTDIHSEINQQVLYHGNGKDVQINRGDPFVLYIPFKRSNKLNLEIRYQNDKDKKIFNKHSINLLSRRIGSGVYRKLQRERDKNS